MFEIIKEHEAGVKLLKNVFFEDKRGTFCKTFSEKDFLENDFLFQPKENFYSISKKNVLRGMHFQISNSAQEKLVSCISGSILDVVVDVRKKSKFFNQVYSFNLDAQSGLSIFIPQGFAHGFLSLSDDSIVNYLVSTNHDLNNDKGIRWDSINFKWPCKNPIVSERDESHPKISEINYF